MRKITEESHPLTAGFSRRRSYFVEDMVCHEDHEINVAVSGQAAYRIKGVAPIELKAGDILLLPGGVSHGIEVAEHFDMAVIHFSRSQFERLDNAASCAPELLTALRKGEPPLPCHKVVSPDIHAALVRLTEDAVVEGNSGQTGCDTMRALLAAQAAVYFLRLMLMEPASEEADETVRRILTVRSWIDRHFAEPCDITALASMANLAPTYFAARFRELTGTPPMTYVRGRRLGQARRMLIQTDEPVKVVAWSVGYADISHFNHAFRSAMHMSPSRYREQSRRS